MPSEFKDPVPGINFDPQTGKLFKFDSESITVMQAWPPVAWRKTRENPQWMRCRPEISIPKGNIEKTISRLEIPAEEKSQNRHPASVPHRGKPKSDRNRLNKLKWALAIPENARDLVCQYRSRQWHMLSFLFSCKEPAEDLINTNPALAFMLANSWVFRSRPVQRPLRSARALLRKGKKQKDILEWLEFPNTESTRKILAKMSNGAINIRTLLYIREALRDPAKLKALRHLKSINLGTARIVASDLIRFATPSLLEELSYSRMEDKKARAAWMLKKVIEMAEYLDRRIVPISEIKNLYRLNDDFSEKIFIRRWEAWHAPIGRISCTSNEPVKILIPPDDSFPLPPIRGNSDVIPIKNLDELREEGRMQHNCVGKYGNRIINGEVCVFRVLRPNRCTLSLQRLEGNTWRISELARARNLPASQEDWEAAMTWFIAASCEQPQLTESADLFLKKFLF